MVITQEVLLGLGLTSAPRSRNASRTGKVASHTIAKNCEASEGDAAFISQHNKMNGKLAWSFPKLPAEASGKQTPWLPAMEGQDERDRKT